MQIILKIMILYLTLGLCLVFAKRQPKFGPEYDKIQTEMEKSYKLQVRNLRAGKCNGFLTEDLARNCVNYYLSAECFDTVFSDRGLEIG